MSEIIQFITDNFGYIFGIGATIVWCILAKFVLSKTQLKLIEKKLNELRGSEPNNDVNGCEIDADGKVTYFTSEN